MGSGKDTQKNQAGFNGEFLQHTWLLWKDILCHSRYLWLSWCVLVATAWGYSWLSQQIGNLSGEFFTVACGPVVDKEGVVRVILTVAGSYWSLAIIQAITKSVTSALAVHVRKVITQRLISLYWSDKNFYKVSTEKELPNPDQMITQDAERFGGAYADVTAQFVASPVFIVFFWIKVSWSVHWSAPIIMLAYYCISFLFQKFIMSPVVRHTFEQEKLEGTLRANFHKSNEFAESVAIYRGQHTEKGIFTELFHLVVENKYKVVMWEWFLYVSSYGFSYQATVLSYLVVSLPLLLGDVSVLSSSYVATSTYDLGMLAWGFTQITVLSTRLSEFAGYTLRVGRLYKFLNDEDIKRGELSLHFDSVSSSFGSPDRKASISFEEGTERAVSLQVDGLSVYTPDGHLVLKGEDHDFEKLTS
eukprot:TRINITY_DN6097_c0_g1_i1.p1 TRINITY_DN6097_c0_g1~~TRINITY_DN6097_c0_g1_i1.p1  ORF type:complete len:416 (-),score=56.62 TRINITY_DN6097_c0_g1_i1:589-1836(-)